MILDEGEDMTNSETKVEVIQEHAIVDVNFVTTT